MATVITTGITTAISAIGSVFTAIFGTDGAMADILPVVGLGIGFYAVSRGIGFLKSLVQGY